MKYPERLKAQIENVAEHDPVDVVLLTNLGLDAACWAVRLENRLAEALREWVACCEGRVPLRVQEILDEMGLEL